MIKWYNIQKEIIIKGYIMRKAFTMIELVFVIVIIGILSAIAIPKFVATRDDATLTKAKTTLASVRSAITQEAQRRQMEGNYTPIFSLSTTGQLANNANIFDYFDGSTTNTRVLNYPIKSCKTNSSTGCWQLATKGTAGANGAAGTPEDYWYVFPKAVYSSNGGGVAKVVFRLQNNRFFCYEPLPANQKMCELLEH